MTIKNEPKKQMKLAAAGVFGAIAVVLSGCGGTTTSSNALFPTPASSPAIYGLEATAANVDGEYFETSGLAPASGPSAAVPIATAAIASNAVPIPALQVNGTIPLGFSPGGQYINAVIAGAGAPGESVVFGVDISNGVDPKTGKVIPINPTGVTLTSPEVGGFTQSLLFNAPLTGPLANDTYRTNAFTLPFTTTGLHQLTGTVADAELNVKTTTFDTVVLKPSDSGVLVQIQDANGNVAGATVSITGALAGAAAYNSTKTAPTVSVTDTQGIAIVFAAPGKQTITVTGPSGGTTVEKGTDIQTLVAGSLFDSTTTSGTTSPYAITIK